LSSTLVPNTWDQSFHANLYSLSQCNTTICTPLNFYASMETERRRWYPKLNCHFVRDTSIQNLKTFQLFGFLHLELVKLIELMRDSGLLNMYYDMCSHLYDLRNKRRHGGFELKESKKEIPFRIADMKIFSIFIMWSFLLMFSFIFLMVEVLAASRCTVHLKKFKIWFRERVSMKSIQNGFSLCFSKLRYKFQPIKVFRWNE